MKLRYDEKPNVIFKELANREAEVRCQLFSDPEEKNRLDFTQRPKTPYTPKLKVSKNIVWWVNFFKSNVYQLKP